MSTKLTTIEAFTNASEEHEHPFNDDSLYEELGLDPDRDYEKNDRIFRRVVKHSYSAARQGLSSIFFKNSKDDYELVAIVEKDDSNCVGNCIFVSPEAVTKIRNYLISLDKEFYSEWEDSIEILSSEKSQKYLENTYQLEYSGWLEWQDIIDNVTGKRFSNESYRNYYDYKELVTVPVQYKDIAQGKLIILNFGTLDKPQYVVRSMEEISIPLFIKGEYYDK